MNDSNARLDANVHPYNWKNPAPNGRYHLVVLGGGTAGLVSAAGAAGLGARVALIERERLGGDCLNTGCVPSKGIIAAADAWKETALAASEFGAPVAGGEGDSRVVFERMRRLRADLSQADSAQRFRDLGVDVFLGEGRFAGPDSLAVAGTELRFRRAVIATGAGPAVPPIDGLASSNFHTNETIFELEQVPDRFMVIGAGPIGCELAQSFARLGSMVTLFDMAPRVLPRDDADAAGIVERSLQADGVELRLGASIERVRPAGDSNVVMEYTINGECTESEPAVLLVAAGRKPRVEGLGLDIAGVKVERSGRIAVDDHQRTDNRRIFAIGDVASPWQFTHAADAGARLMLANALFPGRRRASKLIVPWATYTSPEVAQVGFTVESAREAGVEIDTVTVPFSEIDRAVLAGDDEGFLKIHTHQGSDRIVGITIVADRAGDLLGEGVAAMTNGIGLAKLGGAIHPYPTTAAAYARAADQWQRGRLTPLVQRALSFWFRITR